jgi:class 3 adenylate cyclase/TolB-like protein/Flp pilus assembly protein TadD
MRAVGEIGPAALDETASGPHQRKLAAILCADVVGFSRLMGEDEAATYDALRRLRRAIDPLIAAKSGRIVSSAGDGFLAEFASIVDALSCAVEMQRLAGESNAGLSPQRHLKLRIGVNLGDVIVADDNDIYGDGVNIAARLEALARPGGICLSHSAYEQAKNKLDLPYRALGRHRVKNIAEPVRAYAVGPAAPSPAAIVLARWRGPIITALAAALTISGLGVWLLERPRVLAPVAAPAIPTRLAGRTSVAVLPFKDLSDAAGQTSFAEGLTEEIGNALGRFSTLEVIGKSATAALQSRTLAFEEIGRALGIRYIVEGSIRRAGDRLRINADLTEAPTGRQIWSDVYDAPTKDTLAAQDDVSQRVVGAVAATLNRVEHDRVLHKPIEDLAPFEYILRARADFTGHTRETNDEARTLARRAIELDPDFAEGYSALGWAYYEAATSGWSEFPKDDIDRAQTLAQKAAGLDPSLTSAYGLLANLFLYQGEYERALAQADRAIAINPNDADSSIRRGSILIYAGRPSEAISWLQASLRLDPANAPAAVGLGMAKYFLAQYSDAIEALDRALARDPGRVNQLTAHPLLAACYARLGRMEEAGRERSIVARLSPFFYAERFATQFGTQQARNDMLAGLKAAGFP